VRAALGREVDTAQSCAAVRGGRELGEWSLGRATTTQPMIIEAGAEFIHFIAVR
jgi:hypothetical protein